MQPIIKNRHEFDNQKKNRYVTIKKSDMSQQSN